MDPYGDDAVELMLTRVSPERRPRFTAALRAQVEQGQHNRDVARLLAGEVTEKKQLPRPNDRGSLPPGRTRGSLPPGGSFWPHRVKFDNGEVGVFKATDASPSLDHDDGLDAEEAVLFEVATWHLADAFGEPWSHMVPPTVVRDVEGQLGSVQQWREGEVGVLGAEEQPRGWEAAGFFDRVIVNHDRHVANYLLNPLTLIDHGVSFGDPDKVRSWDGMGWDIERERHWQRPGLSTKERRLLVRLISSPDLLGVAPIIGEKHAHRMRDHWTRMLSRDIVDFAFPPPGIAARVHRGDADPLGAGQTLAWTSSTSARRDDNRLDR